MLPWPEYDVPSFVHQVKLSNQTTCILYEHTTTTTNTTNTTLLQNMLLTSIYYTHVTWKQDPVNFKFPSTSPNLTFKYKTDYLHLHHNIHNTW